MRQIMWPLGTCSMTPALWPVALSSLEVLCNWKASWSCTFTTMDHATGACFQFRRHLKLSQIVGMEEYWVQVMVGYELSVWERPGLVCLRQQLTHFNTITHLNKVYHWPLTTSQRLHYFHWLRPWKGMFLQFLSLTVSRQFHLLLPPPSCFWICHPQMEAVGSSLTAILEHSINTQCGNPKDNCKLERLPWKLQTL